MFWKSIYIEEQFIVIKISGLVKKKKKIFKKKKRFIEKKKKKKRNKKKKCYKIAIMYISI
jgi:hypothetical protein